VKTVNTPDWYQQMQIQSAIRSADSASFSMGSPPAGYPPRFDWTKPGSAQDGWYSFHYQGKWQAMWWSNASQTFSATDPNGDTWVHPNDKPDNPSTGDDSPREIQTGGIARDPGDIITKRYWEKNEQGDSRWVDRDATMDSTLTDTHSGNTQVVRK
jgi:hypothetical protein